MILNYIVLSVVFAGLLALFLMIIRYCNEDIRELKREDSSIEKEKRKVYSIYAGYTSSKT